MAQKINMPRLSDTMTEGTVAKWLKKVGDKIEEGDILAEIETDKATMEFEAFESGTLLYIGLKDGESAPVDTLLAIIGKEGEDYKSLLEDKEDSKKDESEDESKSEDKKESKSEDKKESKSEDKKEDKTDDSKEEKPEADTSKSKELPEGVIVVNMPRLSDTMTEGTVATWLKKVGDKIEEGDILAEIETDKATMEFESFNEGTLLYIGIKEGESAPVDSILAILGPEGTDVTGIAENYASQKEANEPEDSEEKSEDSKDEKKSDKSESKESASTEESSTSSHDDKRVFISPLARKIAEEKGINLNDLKGSGENGRIIKSDIENYKPQEAKPATQAAAAAAAPEKASAPARPFVAAGETDVEEVKNSQMRKTIARRLAESKFTAPHYYLTIEVVMDQAMASRKTINTLPDTKVSFNDLVIKACAMALKKHPRVNSSWKDDVTVINHHVHIGVAVAVEDGLLVPVLPFADQRTLTQIGTEVKNLASKAKSKKLQPSEMEGSTFTVSNLGMFGISEFTSIINQPNSAILSVGAIEEKPIVKDGQIVVGNTMKLTLACDHRTVDGATGAQFLQTLRQYLENPVTMLA